MVARVWSASAIRSRRTAPTPLLLSHYHWDHTHGLPFFGPLYSPGWSPEIFAPALADVPADWIGTLFQPPNFPVPLAGLPIVRP